MPWRRITSSYWLGNRLSGLAKVDDDLINQFAQTGQRVLRGPGKPGERWELEAGGDELLVLGRPGDGERVTSGASHEYGHWSPSFLSIAFPAGEVMISQAEAGRPYRPGSRQESSDGAEAAGG